MAKINTSNCERLRVHVTVSINFVAQTSNTQSVELILNGNEKNYLIILFMTTARIWESLKHSYFVIFLEWNKIVIFEFETICLISDKSKKVSTSLSNIDIQYTPIGRLGSDHSIINVTEEAGPWQRDGESRNWWPKHCDFSPRDPWRLTENWSSFSKMRHVVVPVLFVTVWTLLNQII